MKPDYKQIFKNIWDTLKDFFIMLHCVFYAILVGFYRFLIPPAPKDVSNEIVLITGSGSGIGRQMALSFAKLKAVVVLWDIDEEANRQTADTIMKFGGVCHVYFCDVSKREDVYRVGRKVQEEVGTVDILVNNAGIVIGKSILQCPDDLIEKTFDVNLLAHFWTTKQFLPSMLKRNHGHIVNISSSCGLIGLNKLTDYSATKFGVVGFSEVLNYEIRFSGFDQVHTSVVCPSYVKTGMFAGCGMKFPSLLPELETSETVEKIMKGILQNKHQICIPRLVYMFSCLKTILPVDAMLETFRFFGADSFMDHFKGRSLLRDSPNIDLNSQNNNGNKKKFPS